MRDRLADYQEEYGDLYNLEATPAESTTYRFAKHDKEQFPDIVTANDQGKPYYTNSSHLPVGYTDDIFSALDVQDELQTLYTSGTVFHAFLGEKLPDWQSTATLVRKIAENYKLPYYTMSPTYSVCKNHGYIAGEVYECPCCHEETEVYSRITGYYRPVKNWNDGKSQEFADRVVYDLGHSHLVKGDAQVAAAAAAVAGAAGSAGAAAKAGEGEAMTVSDAVAAAMGEAAPQAAGPAAAEAPESSMLPAGRYLVATRTCPNCKHAAAQMDQAGIAYEELLAEENVELAQRFRIMQAPDAPGGVGRRHGGHHGGRGGRVPEDQRPASPGGGVRALSSRQPALPVRPTGVPRAYTERQPHKQQAPICGAGSKDRPRIAFGG